jgi:hypothetical protein
MLCSLLSGFVPAELLSDISEEMFQKLDTFFIMKYDWILNQVCSGPADEEKNVRVEELDSQEGGALSLKITFEQRCSSAR